MKKLIWIVIICLVFSSCRKIETIEESKTVLVKVEAIHTTGQIVTSDIVLVK